MFSRVTNDKLIDADEFLVHPAARGRSELVRGEIRAMTPAGGPHGLVSGNVSRLLSTHVRAHRAGVCFADSTGFALPNLDDTVRAPDASFVRADRLPPDGVVGGFLHMAPDLAVEVLSPSESASDLAEKLADYQAAGTPVVWVIDPARRTVTVVSSEAPLEWLASSDTLRGGRVLPEFSCPVASLFEGLAAGAA